MKQALVIQDDIILLKILERLVSINNFNCRAIRSINDLELEDQQIEYDVIISDILFDGIAPLDYVYHLQEIVNHHSLVIITNMGQEKVKQEMLATNKVDGFFPIPFDLDNIEKFFKVW